MTTELTTSSASITTITPSPRELTGSMLAMIFQLAPTIHASRLFKGIASPEQAAVIMLKGFELGFPLTASFELIEMIEGKAALKPQGALALLHKSRNFDIDVVDGQDYCTVTMKRRDTGFTYTATFGLADAQRAGLTEGSLKGNGEKRGRGNYEAYAPDMYRARAIARCARMAGPDVLAGLYLTAELITEPEEVQA